MTSIISPSIFQPVPILLTADTLVTQGTLTGCRAAFLSAVAGRQTVLASSACSIPHEHVVCRRPWINEKELTDYPPPIQGAFRESVIRTLDQGELLINLAQLAIRMEDVLLDAGVRIFYGMSPCGILRDSSGRTVGRIFGGKFGLNAIEADEVVGEALRIRLDRDTVEVAVSAKINVQDVPEPAPGEVDHRSAAEKQRISDTPPEETSLSVPGIPELIHGRIAMHGPYAEIRLRVPNQPRDPLGYASINNHVRRILLDLGRNLNAERKIQGIPPLLIHRFSGNLLPISPVESVLPNFSLLRGQIKGTVRAELTPVPGERPHPENSLSNRLTLRFTDAPPLHASGKTVLLDPEDLPVFGECDVLVAGGGTSGVPAALEAARAGVRTILLEQQDDVGGTHTVGGVGNFWYGRETPFHREFNGACDALVNETGVAVELAMRKVLAEAGVRVVSGCAMGGVVMEDDRIAGLLVITDRGVGIILGKVVLDATGDADLAAWAGAPCEYGNGRDAWTLWASFANFNEVRRTASRQYESTLEIRDPYDFTRFAMVGRRRQGMWRRHEHEMPQSYVTPRESRRLKGEATVTYGDILSGKTYSDLVAVCESNFDIKGISSSDLINSGIIWSWNTHRRYRAAIPFRALLPRGVENLLVIGKAYSASHDAMCLARMQRDMGCLGASGGIAAATAVCSETSLRNLDIPALQKKWVARGTLFPQDLQEWAIEPALYPAEAVAKDAASLEKSGSDIQRKLARLARKKQAVPDLLRAFHQAKGRAPKVKIARTLCLLGNAETVPFLLETVAEQIRHRLPCPHKGTLSIPPEHGWTGDPVYSLFAIGLTEDAVKAAPLLERVATMVDDDPSLYMSRTHSPFEYVRMICAVAERNPGPAMKPALEKLLSKRSLTGLSVRYDADVRQVIDPALERRAYLELCIGRALARCADRRGYDLLLRFTHDIRGTLARSARDELTDMLDTEDTSSWTVRIDQALTKGTYLPYNKRIH